MPKRFLREIKGLNVIGAKGKVLGEVSDIEISGSRITGLVVRVLRKHTKVLGLKKPFLSRANVVIPARYIKVISDVLVLNISVRGFGVYLAQASANKAPQGNAGATQPALSKGQ